MGARYTYDAFISHAVEDKLKIANELDEKLRARKLEIWYSSRELHVGSNITDTIKEGLSQSRFGIVILSKNYLAKSWPMREFYMLMSRGLNGKQVILPVLHEITLEELAARDPDMIDMYAIPADRGIDYVVETLVTEINNRKIVARHTARKKIISVIGMVILAMCLLGGIAWALIPTPSLSQEFIEQSIHERIDALQQKVDADIKLELRTTEGKLVHPDTITQRYTAFQDFHSRYRNTYSFSNGYSQVTSKKRVTAELGMEVENLNPMNEYLLYNPRVYLLQDTQLEEQRQIRYAFVNSQPVTFSVVSNTEGTDQSFYTITVQYENNIRYIESGLKIPASADGIKYHSLSMIGFRPQETYRFEKSPSGWTYSLLSKE